MPKRAPGWPDARRGCRTIVLRLDLQHALHAHRKVWRAVEIILARRQTTEREHKELAWRRLQAARELRHPVGAEVGVELVLCTSRNLCRVKRYVMRATRAFHDELDTVTHFCRDVRRLKPI